MQSVCNKQEQLEAFIDSNSTYQAICISESWITQEKQDLIHFTGYKMAGSFIRKNQAGGGVCILLQDHIEYKEKRDITNLSLQYRVEVCAVELVKENLIIILLYWNGLDEAAFYSRLKLILNLINKKYSKYNIVVGGDFNINILKRNNKCLKLLNLMSEYNFKQHINKPTRITKTTSRCLDHIYTNFDDKFIIQTSVEELGFCDHASTSINLKIPQQNINNKTCWYTKKRLYNNKKNISNFRQKLSSIEWKNVLKPNVNINTNYEIFHNILDKLLNENIPKIKIKLRTNFNKYWITKGIKISCKNKRLLKILTQKTNSPILNQHYKSYEKTLKKCITYSKKLHYINRIKLANNKTKAMWNIIKERTNKNKSKEKVNIKLKINNAEFSDPQQVSNSFNNFFASIGDPDHTPGSSRPRPCGRSVISPSENSMFLAPVTPQEVQKAIKNLKNKKSFGIDEIPPCLFKECYEELTQPLTLLINQSYSEGIFPSLLKQTIIRPIHKKDKKNDLNNYRPIALLPTASKIFEKIICDRVYKFCEKYKLFDECQNGFRKNRSTTLAVYKYMREIIKILENKQYGIGILLDMTKAYDKVQHNILLNKLYGIGIRGTALNWFASYLQDRQQYVEIEYYDYNTKEIQTIRSESKTVNASIPQGSVVGCLLFLIYINDLPKVIKEPCVLFADDISLLTSCKNGTNIHNKLHSILTNTSKWLNEHNLDINFKKTKIMCFHPHQKKPLNINFEFNGTKIECVNNFTLLGLDIDNHVTWKTHIKKIHSKLSSFAYALREVKKTTNIDASLTMYYAYAYAWLNYGIILWGNSPDAHTLLTMQKKLIRILANIPQYESCKSYFQKYNVLTVPSVYIFEIAKFVRNYPEYFTKLGDLERRYPQRHKNKLVMLINRLRLNSTSTLIMSIKIYNKLPKQLTEEKKDKLFLSKLKQYLINKAYYSVNEFLNEKL